MYQEDRETAEGNALHAKADMNIIPENGSGLYAYGTVNIGDMFSIRDVKVVFLKDDDGEDKLTVCMPRYLNKRKNTWEPVVFLTKDQKAELDRAVITDIKSKMMIHSGSITDNLHIRTTLVGDNYYPTVGYAELTYQECLTVKHIRISAGDNGELQVTFPSNQMKNGTYINLFGMATGEMQKEMVQLVTDSFTKTYKEKHGHEFVPKAGKPSVPSEGLAVR